MSDPAQIEQEIKAFLAIEDNLRKSDRLPYLMAIINKHFAVDKIDHIVINHELQEIIGNAKMAYAKTPVPMYISKKEIRDVELNFVLVMEAFVGYLNRNKLLKRVVKFDHRR